MVLKDEMMVLVDENDQPVGREEKMKTHELGLLHRAFSVCIFRGQGDDMEFLLQRRQDDKYHCGGLWTNTCCSHPRADEAVLDAGSRRLAEEMGFSVQLEDVGTFIYKAAFTNGLIEHELDHVLLGTTEKETFNYNSEEVAEVKWLNVKNLFDDLEKNPNHYTPWFLPALEIAWKAVLA